MTKATVNDNDPTSLRDWDIRVDARAQAALLLTESLLHGLIARRVLSTTDAMDIVKTAIDVQRDTLADLAGPDPAMERSLAYLTTMQGSLDADLIRD